MLISFLADSINEDIEEVEPLGPGFYLPIIIIGVILLLLVAILLIAKRKGLGPIPTKLTLQMPRASIYLTIAFSIVFVVGAILSWFLLDKDMEYRLLTQIVISVVAVLFSIIFPLNARIKLTVEGNEIAYRPMVGKERIYSFKDISIIVIKASGFDGNTYKYYDKDGKKLFSFSGSTPYSENFFELVKATNKKVTIVDKRVIGPTTRR